MIFLILLTALLGLGSLLLARRLFPLTAAVMMLFLATAFYVSFVEHEILDEGIGHLFGYSIVGAFFVDLVRWFVPRS